MAPERTARVPAGGFSARKASTMIVMDVACVSGEESSATEAERRRQAPSMRGESHLDVSFGTCPICPAPGISTLIARLSYLFVGSRTSNACWPACRDCDTAFW